MAEKVIGVNGLGRVGKTFIWASLAKGNFDRIVVNLGREAGKNPQDGISAFSRDSTYGSLDNFLFGRIGQGQRSLVSLVNRTVTVNNKKVVFILPQKNSGRRPEGIPWGDYGVKLVVDTTGKFKNPGADINSAKGALAGHLAAGAKKVLFSAPFKPGKGENLPENAITIVSGINDDMYDPAKHCFISAASCTTTCMVYMLDPLLKKYGAGAIDCIEASTIHAVTGTQPVLDRMPDEDASDLRKNRSPFNNIIPTTTGAAKAVKLVLPALKGKPFDMISLRVPTNTGSLVKMTVDFKEHSGPDSADEIRETYWNYDSQGHLLYSDDQNVSADIIGSGQAAIIEGTLTQIIEDSSKKAILYGWYDNEMGYSYMLSDLAEKIWHSLEE